MYLFLVVALARRLTVERDEETTEPEQAHQRKGTHDSNRSLLLHPSSNKSSRLDGYSSDKDGLPMDYDKCNNLSA